MPLDIYHQVREHKQHLWLLFLPALQLGKHKASCAKQYDSFLCDLSRLPLSSPWQTTSPGWAGLTTTLTLSWASNRCFNRSTCQSPPISWAWEVKASCHITLSYKSATESCPTAGARSAAHSEGQFRKKSIQIFNTCTWHSNSKHFSNHKMEHCIKKSSISFFFFLPGDINNFSIEKSACYKYGKKPFFFFFKQSSALYRHNSPLAAMKENIKKQSEKNVILFELEGGGGEDQR